MWSEKSLGIDEISNMPQTGNTGAVNTYPNGLRSLVDWFEGTLKIPQIAGNGERELIEMMGLNYDDFRPLEYGFRKWRKG
ncbi:hypothetical protein, partial [Brevibacillus sp. SYSU BS000544]|uniref:hypothetical protein n=1 Tax=Brevibacillus sp. SYSU BS000544 TaxID=3416443 RepID=UPI003CE521A0